MTMDEAPVFNVSSHVFLSTSLLKISVLPSLVCEITTFGACRKLTSTRPLILAFVNFPIVALDRSLLQPHARHRRVTNVADPLRIVLDSYCIYGPVFYTYIR